MEIDYPTFHLFSINEVPVLKKQTNLNENVGLKISKTCTSYLHKMNYFARVCFNSDIGKQEQQCEKSLKEFVPTTQIKTYP